MIRDRSDWKLNSETFHQINRCYGPLEVDLFASRLTNQVPTLLQLAAISGCRGHRCLNSFSRGRNFANPSWRLIVSVLNQAQTQEADLVIVTLLWKAQPWYALILTMLVNWPRPLPHQELVTIMSVSPQLVVWSISGKALKAKDFQTRLQASLPTLGGLRQPSLTIHSSSDGIAGVVRGIPIGTCEQSSKLPSLFI